MVIPQVVRADFLGQEKNKLKTSELMSSKRHEAMAVYCKTMEQLGLLAGPPQSSPAVFKADHCLKFCAACAAAGSPQTGFVLVLVILESTCT